MPSKLLIPIDGTPLSKRALEFAFDNFGDSEIVCLHVQNSVDPAYGEGVDVPVSAADWQLTDAEERIKIVTDQVTSEAETVAERHGKDIEIVTTRGKPYRKIVEYVEDFDIDHVVIGSHGRSGRDRLLLGSVSENVVKQAPVNVTVVRTTAGDG
jgi:nucleotide-binding universal stress UspA family protein